MVFPDDDQLISQIRGGDLKALETLYDKYKEQIYRTALAITRDQQAAEDILQDCFLRLHDNVNRLDGSVPIAPWLHRVTVNLRGCLKSGSLLLERCVSRSGVVWRGLSPPEEPFLLASSLLDLSLWSLPPAGNSRRRA